MSKLLHLLFLFLLFKGKKYTKTIGLNEISEILLSDNCVYPLSAKEESVAESIAEPTAKPTAKPTTKPSTESTEEPTEGNSGKHSVTNIL